MIKVYKTGQEFLQENSGILAKYPLETVFFKLNASLITYTNSTDFLIKSVDKGKYLLAVHIGEFPMVIFGDNSLCAEFARFAVKERLTFPKVLGELDTCEAFLAEYDKLAGCTHSIYHAMDIMRCGKPNLCDTQGVEFATDNDLDELANIAASFDGEAMGENRNADYYKQSLRDNIRNFALIRSKNGRIVSVAAKVRETERLCAISWVYTVPQYRNRGLSCKIVTYLTKAITDSGRLAYLFVDKANPISNHLYGIIGYTYAAPQYEIKLIRNS